MSATIKETIKAQGRLRATLFDADGNIKQEIDEQNLIVNLGRNGIADQLLPSPSIAKPSHMQLGSGSTAPTLSDTNLQTALGSRVVIGVSRNNNTVTYTGVFGPGVSTGSIQEAGIFNAATGGNMYARITFGVITKGADDTLELNWSWTIGA